MTRLCSLVALFLVAALGACASEGAGSPDGAADATLADSSSIDAPLDAGPPDGPLGSRAELAADGLLSLFCADLREPVKIDTRSIVVVTASATHVVGDTAAAVAPTGYGLEVEWAVSGELSVKLQVRADGPHFDLELSTEPAGIATKCGFSVVAGADEFLTGLMERTVDGGDSLSMKTSTSVALDLRGQQVKMRVWPTMALYQPFYLSSRGYGLFVRGTWPGEFDLGQARSDRIKILFEGPALSFRVFAAAQPAALVQAHAMEVGPPILPPRWAFAPWRWRDEHENRATYFDGTAVTAPYNSQVIEDILLMEHYDIPCGGYWVDRPWAIGAVGYEQFEWDLQRLPDPAGMVSWINSKGIAFLLWIAPWVYGAEAQLIRQRGYALPGQEHDVENRALIDFTNPAARSWWQGQLKKVLDLGVAGFKLDRSEEIVPSSLEHTADDGRTTRELRNDYPHLYLQAAHEAAKAAHGDEILLMPRAAYSGSTRYGVFWGGDIRGTEGGLRAAIVAVQRAAIIGYPFWGSDTGGYWGGEDREVTARWLAFSAFTPIMEVGPTWNGAFWDMPSAPAYDEQLIAIWRLYAHLHTRLQDYTLAHAKRAHQTGMPIVRPLFLAYPEQPQAWEQWQTYLYGEDILVSAIWRKGVAQQSVYLPSGERWRDAWDAKVVHDGGQIVVVQTPRERIPIFIREGATVELGDLPALYAASLARAKVKPEMAALEASIGN